MTPGIGASKLAQAKEAVGPSLLFFTIWMHLPTRCLGSHAMAHDERYMCSSFCNTVGNGSKAETLRAVMNTMQMARRTSPAQAWVLPPKLCHRASSVRSPASSLPADTPSPKSSREMGMPHHAKGVACRTELPLPEQLLQCCRMQIGAMLGQQAPGNLGQNPLEALPSRFDTPGSGLGAGDHVDLTGSPPSPDHSPAAAAARGRPASHGKLDFLSPASSNEQQANASRSSGRASTPSAARYALLRLMQIATFAMHLTKLAPNLAQYTVGTHIS